MRFEIGQQVFTPEGRGCVIEIVYTDNLGLLLTGYPDLCVLLKHSNCTDWFLISEVQLVPALEQLAEAAE